MGSKGLFGIFVEFLSRDEKREAERRKEQEERAAVKARGHHRLHPYMDEWEIEFWEDVGRYGLESD